MRTIIALAATLSGAFFHPTANAALSAQEVYNKASPSIVVVVAFDAQGKPFGSGSGIAVEKGRVVTNWHVVEKASSLLVKRKDTNYKAVLISDRRDRDLAVLDVPGLDAPVVKQGSIKGLSVGQPVYAIGAPSGLELTLTSGIVSALRDIDDGKLIQISAAISPGSSGGGLFDDQGQLIGVTTLKLAGNAQEGLGFATPVDWVRQLVSPDQKLQDSSSGWIWITGLIPILFAIFFGKRIAMYLADRFSPNSFPAQSAVDDIPTSHTHDSAHGQAEIPLSVDLAKFAMTAQEELQQGLPDPAVYKQAQTFASGDSALVDQFYIRFRASALQDAANAANALSNRDSPSTNIHPQRSASQNDSVYKRRRIAMAISIALLVLFVFAGAPWLTGIVIERKVRSFVADSETSDAALIKTKIDSYNRHWLGSEIVTTHSLGNSGGILKIKHLVKHIPQWKDGASIYFASNPIFENASIYKSEEIKGASYFYANGKLSSLIEIANIGSKPSPNDPSTIVSLRGATITLERTSNETPTSLSLKIAGASMEDKDIKLGLSDLSLSVDNLEILHNRKSLDLNLALSIGSVLADEPKTGKQSKTSGVAYTHSQKRNGDLLDGEIKLSIKEFQGKDNKGFDATTKDFSTDFSITKLSASALSDWESLIKHATRDSTQTSFSAILPHLLKNSPSISSTDTRFTIVSKGVEGNIEGVINVSAVLSVNADGLAPETSTLQDYRRRLKLSSKLSSSKSLVLSLLETTEREKKEKEVKNAIQQGKQVTEEEAKSHIAKARGESEASLALIVNEGFVTSLSDSYETKIEYANDQWSINGKDPLPFFTNSNTPKHSKPVSDVPPTESHMDRAVRSNNELRAETYQNQTLIVKQRVRAGLIQTSQFNPKEFHDITNTRAYLQKHQIVEASSRVTDALRDREIWWMDNAGFHMYISNITNGVLTGMVYELDYGGDCKTQRRGPFLYYPIQFNPPIQSTDSRMVDMPRGESSIRLANGKMICGTLVTVW
jgi:S1-C subfamily serine protease